jgi:hypothetical protein
MADAEKKAFVSRVLGRRQKIHKAQGSVAVGEAGSGCASVGSGALHPRSSVLADGRVQCACEACRPEHRRGKRQLRVAATAEQPQTQRQAASSGGGQTGRNGRAREPSPAARCPLNLLAWQPQCAAPSGQSSGRLDPARQQFRRTSVGAVCSAGSLGLPLRLD